MYFAGQVNRVAGVAKVVRDGFGARVDTGVAWIGAGLYRIEPGVDVVSGRGTHRRGLEATGELQAFLGQRVQVRSFGLPTIDLHVEAGAVVGDDEEKVGAVDGGGGEGEEERGENEFHGYWGEPGTRNPETGREGREGRELAVLWFYYEAGGGIFVGD